MDIETVQSAFRARRTAALLALLLLAWSDVADDSCRADSMTTLQPKFIRLRVEWGGGQPRQWHGLAEISKGTLQSVRSLGLNASESQSLWIDRNTLAIRRSTPHIYDGFDLEIDASRSAVLTLSLQSPEAPRLNEQIRIPLVDLDSKTFTQTLGNENVQLYVRRTPGDALAIHPKTAHLIFAPGETFQAEMVFRPLDRQLLKNAKSINWRLLPAGSSSVLDRGTITLPDNDRQHDRALTECHIPLPADEGVYDLNFVAGPGDLASSSTTVQLLVFAAGGPSTPTSAEQAIEDKNREPMLVDSFSTDDLSPKRLIAKPRTNRLVDNAVDGLKMLFPSLTNAPTADSKAQGDVRWFAHRIKVRHPGQPHRLVLEFPRVPSLQMGISLLEPNAAQQLLPIGLESGLFVAENSPSLGQSASQGPQQNEMCRHEILYWPRHHEPILLFHDVGSTSALPTCRVELYEIPRQIYEQLKLPVNEPKSEPQKPLRLVGPYLRKPLLPESFGGAEALDEPTGRSLDDWNTFYSASQHLSRYLTLQGYNSLLLSVFSEGSTLYPSELLSPTPRYDTGVYFSTGQDPVRKDVLELLFQEFDRNQLTLVPLLQFSTPLPELERQLVDKDRRQSGMVLLNQQGQTGKELPLAAQPVGPNYNPLDPRVQDAVRNVVKELATRYKDHASFRHLALELGSQGYLQLPGLEWGYDDATIERFAQATGTELPAADDSGQREVRNRFLTEQVGEQWIRWRCQELARFHQSLAATVQEIAPQVDLILAGHRLIRADNDRQQANSYEAFESGQRMSALLAEKGLDFQLYRDVPHLRLLAPALYGNPADKLQTALDERINMEITNQQPSNSPTGQLIYHQPREVRIAEFDDVSPWQPAYTWMATPLIPYGDLNKKRYSDALASRDQTMIFEGGWSVLLGQEDATRNHRQVFQKLPAIAFRDISETRQSVVARTATDQDKTYFYFVNEMSAPARVSLQLKCPSATTGHFLGTNDPLLLDTVDEPSSHLQLEIPPFEIRAFVLEQDNVPVLNLQTQLDSQTIAALGQSIQQFDRAVASVQHVPQIERSKIHNAGFENNPQSRGTLAGWHISRNQKTDWSIDTENPRSGNGSLLLTSLDSRAEAFSSDFDLESHPSVLVSAWLRSDSKSAPVRMALELTVDGKTQIRNATVSVDEEWRRYVLRVTDIPQVRIENAKVRIEIEGKGKLWIDDVELQTQQISPHEQRQITKTYAALNLAWEEKRYADCQRLLGSYWVQRLVQPDEFARGEISPSSSSQNPKPSILKRLFSR